MSAGRLSVSLIVLSVLPGVLTKVDNCDGLTTREGYIDCVSFPSKYKDSQWAVCASQREVSRNNKYRCHGSYCWLTCMGITTGRKRGMVSQKCRCKSSDWKNRPIQLLDPNCYLPSSNDCTWFTNCLSKYKDCPESSNTFADPFAQYLCGVFVTHSEHLSASGNRYIRSLLECLQREMFHLILPSNNQTCSERTDIAKTAHNHCLNLNSLTTTFCDLPVNDQSYIFWTSKSAVTKAFGDSGRGMLDSFRNCYQGNVQSAEEQICITVDAEDWKGVQSTVEDFAQMLNWPLKSIVWDGHNIPQISNSTKAINIIFKPEADFDFTINRQSRSAVDANVEYNKLIAQLPDLNLERNILEISLPKEHIMYFPEIGICPFHKGEGGIFDKYSPEPLDKIKVKFTLYRKQSSATITKILDYFNNDTILKSSYDSSKRTYFIVHGFTSDGKVDWIKNMVSAFLQQEDCNIVVVDWNMGADIHWTKTIVSAIISFISQPLGIVHAGMNIAYDYIQAAVNTRLVGCFIGKMVEKLNMLMKTSYTNVHIIGHSLGAHVSGFAGLYTQGKIGRISGLDSAGPAFTDLGVNYRLDQTDAIFVDVIHTDTEIAGIDQPIGHIDFYPNGGNSQPGCYYPSCSHGRAHALFTESISPVCTFWACRCSRDEFNKGKCNTGKICDKMGFPVDQSKRGSFFLNTNRKSPFCTDKLPTRKRKKRMINAAGIFNENKKRFEYNSGE